MKVGITGHQRLEDSSAWPWVRAELDAVLRKLSRALEGWTSLAIGADQMFANAILATGGAIVAVIPFESYELKILSSQGRTEYSRLLALASAVEVLQRHGSDEEAYFAAGRRIVDATELLVAIWDGRAARGVGGTADVVGYAKIERKPIIQIEPSSRTVAKL